MRIYQLVDPNFDTNTYYEKYLRGVELSPIEILMTLDNFAYAFKNKIYNINPINNITSILIPTINKLENTNIVSLLDSLRTLRYHNEELTNEINKKLMNSNLANLSCSRVIEMVSSLYTINQERVADELVSKLSEKFDGISMSMMIEVLHILTRALPKYTDELLIKLFKQINKSKSFLRRLTEEQKISLATSVWIFNRVMSKTAKDILRPSFIVWASKVSPIQKKYHLEQTYREQPIENFTDGPLTYDLYFPNNKLVIEIKDHIQYLYTF